MIPNGNFGEFSPIYPNKVGQIARLLSHPADLPNPLRGTLLLREGALLPPKRGLPLQGDYRDR